jgi:hypothetical protein
MDYIDFSQVAWTIKSTLRIVKYTLQRKLQMVIKINLTSIVRQNYFEFVDDKS